MNARTFWVDSLSEKSYYSLMDCLFVSDLHGDISRYEKLFCLMEQEKPAAVFIGGDMLPRFFISQAIWDFNPGDFVNDFLLKRLLHLKTVLGEYYPQVFVILGNDDGRFEEAAVLDAATKGVWHYCHYRSLEFDQYRIYGYSYVPPTPFSLKDWERHDISRYTDPGSIPIDEGYFSHPVSESEKLYSTIHDDLEKLVGSDNLGNAIFLFHSPPYNTNLDRAALDGKKIDHVPLDLHVGSIAIKRFIEERKPLVTLHGHVHESARISGFWKEQIGRTHAFSAAHDGPELAVVRFNPQQPEKAVRQLI